ncbi:hypothetical protein [Chitinophaga oryzae]|nr:hypothetical protein [Chitinophaga oryzae]
MADWRTVDGRTVDGQMADRRIVNQQQPGITGKWQTFTSRDTSRSPPGTSTHTVRYYRGQRSPVADSTLL